MPEVDIKEMTIPFPQTQQIHFNNGTVKNLTVLKIVKGTWTHLITKDGEVIVNPNNVLFIKVTKLGKDL